MEWWQGQSYSEDLRSWVLAAIDSGMAARAAARLFRGKRPGFSAASGRYDRPSGRYLGIDDDLDEMLSRIDEITGRELERFH